MFSSPLSHARVSHTRTASVKPSLLRPTHRAKRNDPHRRTTIAISPVIETAPIDVDHDRADRDLAIDTSRDHDRDHRNQRDCDRDLADRDRSDRDRDLTEKLICPSGFYLSF